MTSYNELRDGQEFFGNGYKKGYKEGYKQAILDGKTNFSRPQGEWIAREDMDYLDENKVVHNHFECDKCGFIHDFIDGHTSQYNFCPNCGAKMKKSQTQKFADNDAAYGGLASAT